MQKIKLKKNVYRRYICMLAKKTKTKNKTKKQQPLTQYLIQKS